MAVGILDQVGDFLTSVGDIAIKGLDVFEDIRGAVGSTKDGKAAKLPPPGKKPTGPVGTAPMADGFEGLNLGALASAGLIVGVLALVVVMARR